MRKFDIAIIGGGASGLAAAITAKRTNKKASVALIERLPKVGKKILATGNGRCNLSNTDPGPKNYIGSCMELLKTTADFSVVDFFESLGMICDDDGYGRIYPHCRSAASVLDALRLGCTRLGVTELCGFEVKGIDTKNGFTIRSDNETISAGSVILAGGGKSQSALGSNGSMFDICSDLGIKLRAPFPALVPLKTDSALVKPLKGQRVEANVGYHCYIPTAFRQGTARSSRGEVQFTDGLLSGICVFDLSHFYEGFCYKKDCELQLDLLPDTECNEVKKLLECIKNIRADASAEDLLSGIFTRPMGIYVLKRALGKLPEKAKDISDLDAVTETIKALSFPITGTAGFERSQVTGGGILYNDPDTFEQQLTNRFEITKLPGMYACGELLDIHGLCGGYNLDFAFSSGALAGKFAASDLYKRK